MSPWLREPTAKPWPASSRPFHSSGGAGGSACTGWGARRWPNSRPGHVERARAYLCEDLRLAAAADYPSWWAAALGAVALWLAQQGQARARGRGLCPGDAPAADRRLALVARCGGPAHRRRGGHPARGRGGRGAGARAGAATRRPRSWNCSWSWSDRPSAPSRAYPARHLTQRGGSPCACTSECP